MHDTFRDAPVLGSLLNPAKSAASKIVEWGELSDFIDSAMQKETKSETHEAMITAQGVVKSSAMLSDKYDFVSTNVPYLGRGDQTEKLKKYCDEYFAAGAADLATSFLIRILDFAKEGGKVGVVSPQAWLLQAKYIPIRTKLLEENHWNLMSRLGTGAFETISGQVVNVLLGVISKKTPSISSRAPRKIALTLALG